jgi:hypothetical protein
MVRRAAAFVLMIMTFGACGGSEGGAGGETSSDVSSEAPAATGAVPTGGADGDGDGDTGGQGTGTVTVGDTTWEVVADIQCIDFGVAMGLQGHAVDDPEVSVTLDANTDEPTMAGASVDGGDAFHWRAGEEFEDFGGTTPETTIEDGVGRGTATFVDTLSGPDYVTAEGSWEFSC